MSAAEGADDEAKRSPGSGREAIGASARVPAPSPRKARRAKGSSAIAQRRGETPKREAGGQSLYPAGGRKRDVETDDDGDPLRKPAWRDYGRIVHSASFRRLQGKTQVFPVHESDFFRNRLTHSLEVAQIAEGIAQRLNGLPAFRHDPINERLCVNAALIHDLGHPPFGHNGERALDDAMRAHGGFEGNAQTIRIITRLEKKFVRISDEIARNAPPGEDLRGGLGLTYRTILSALKYDKVIPPRDGDDGLVKGYYASEAPVIERAKSAVDPQWRTRGIKEFKTIECSVMDIADDIAYSTYDLEDCLKAGFLSPADILSTDPELFEEVAQKTNANLPKGVNITGQEALGIFSDLFAEIFDTVSTRKKRDENFVDVYRLSKSMCEDGYVRTALSSKLVGEAIHSVKLRHNKECPWLSKAYLPTERLKNVEVLKHFTFLKTVRSARVKVGEYRGYEVITKIFDALSKDKNGLLMPEDLKKLHKDSGGNATARKRAICDFIAGMTDRYALEFYARLHSDDPQSIFKPI